MRPQTSRDGKTTILLRSGSPESHRWQAMVKTTLDNDHNLAAGSYKLQMVEKAPAELIREWLEIEREIERGLRVLQEVGQ